MAGDSRGQMPFAAIAVTILVMSVICSAVVADYGRASDNADSVREDAEAVERAVAGIERHIDRGLGEQILSVSRDDAAGDLEDRMDAFRANGDRWLLKQFPLVDAGIRAEYVSHDIELRAESVRYADGNPDETGHVPAYLRAVGTVTVRMDTHSGEAVKVLRISTDGSYALPFVAAQGSLFENMVGDGGISISQMVEYQLTSLAQYRVTNGYGGSERLSGSDTLSIITESDVRRAYDNALSAIGLICFRTCPDGFERFPGIDLADRLVLDYGEVRLDLSMFYAQALMAYIDRVALSWFEYFCMDEVFGALTQHYRTMLDVGRSIKAVLTGESVFGAESYIREAMSRSGYSQDEWEEPGRGTTEFSVCGRNFSVEHPTADLLDQHWIRHFKVNSRMNQNYVMDGMREILRDAAVKLADRQGMGSIVVEVDETDSRTFAQDLKDAIDSNLGKCKTSFGSILKKSADRRDFADPFGLDVANTISSESDVFYRSDEFRSALVGQLEAAFPECMDDECDVPDCPYRDTEEGCDDPSHRLCLSDIVSDSEIESLVHGYERSVSDDLRKLDVLRHQPGERNIIEELVSGIASYFLTIPAMLAPVDDTMHRMCEELCETVDLNPHSGLTGLPTDEVFRFVDANGNVSRERIALTSVVSSPVITVSYETPGSLRPGEKPESVHNIGFGTDLLNAYTTVVKVSVKDNVYVTLDGSGELASSMDLVTTKLTEHVSNDFALDIPVVSGWALAGIVYDSSTDLIRDVAGKLAEFLEPILEPLRKTFATIRAAITATAEKITELGMYAARAVSELYTRVMEPIQELFGMISEYISGKLSTGQLSFINSISHDLQRTTICYCGYTLTFKTDAGSWDDERKYILGVVLTGKVSGMDFEAGLDFRNKGEDVNRYNIGLTGHGKLSGDGWSVSAKLDPLMKFSNRLLTLNGHTRSNTVTLTVPELVEYHEVGMSLADTAAGPMISNIPLPVPGLKAGFDAGFEIRYTDPEKRGLVINEMETNPEGPDGGKEWAEILNNSPVPVCLDGCTLVASSDWKKKVMPLSGTLAPGEFLVVEPDFTLVNEKGKHTRNGEALSIKDQDGTVLDKTPTVRDSKDDGNTWHRVKDGALDWTFGPSSRGESNGSRMSGVFSESGFLEIAEEAIRKTFDDIPTIYGMEDASEFLRLLVRNTLDIMIDRITGSILDASVYAKVQVGDLTGAASCGLTVAFRAYQGLAADVLRYIAGQLQVLLLNADNPYRIDPVGMFAENMGLEVTVDTGIGVPRIIGGSEGMSLGVCFRTNVSALTHLFGKDTGRPEIEFGILSHDCPPVLVPSKMKANKDMHCDFWLLHMTVGWR